MLDAPSHSRMDEQIAVQKGNCHFRDSLAFAFLQERGCPSRMAAIQIPLFPAAIDFDGSNGAIEDFCGLAKWIEGPSDQHRGVGYCLSFVALSAPALAKFLAV